MVTSKMTRMNVYNEVHLEIIIMHKCSDYSNIIRMNVHERMGSY